MKRQQLYKKARQNIEKQRQNAESQQLAAMQQLMQTQPRLREIQAQIAQAGAQAAILAAGGNPAAAREKLAQQQALSAQKQQLLAQLQAGQATALPACPHCQGSGWQAGSTCSCVLNEMKRLRREEISTNGPLQLCRFESFKLERYPETFTDSGQTIPCRQLMGNILSDCVHWAQDFGPYSQSLFMYGNAGLGKTHLALSIACAVLERGFDVIYLSAAPAFSQLTQGASGGGGDELFASMLQADLLVLDDLGTEFLNAYVRGKLYELVNARMNRRPTIYTTNIYSRQVLEQRYDEKISSRLLGSCHPMRFFGEDLRLQKP